MDIETIMEEEKEFIEDNVHSNNEDQVDSTSYEMMDHDDDDGDDADDGDIGDGDIGNDGDVGDDGDVGNDVADVGEVGVIGDVDNEDDDNVNNIDEERELNQGNNYQENLDNFGVKTRRSLRNQGKEMKSPTQKEKKGTKRKSLVQSSESPSSSSNRTKIPKFEFTPIHLEAKTIILSDSKSHNYVLDRSKLITIPPKEGIFGVGDLIWAKMQGYPWWPCMITIDPVTGSYSKISGVSYKAERVYHVQYFGSQPYRGWTNIGMIMPFEGFEKFRQKIEEELKDADKKKKAKIEAKYIVKNSILKKWNESISEAEEALELSIQHRVSLLTFNYVIASEIKTPRSNNKSSTSRASMSSLNSNSSKKVSEDVYDFDDDEDDAFGNGSLPEFVFRKRLPKGEYNVFLKKHFDEEAKKNPELSKTEINKKLKEKWCGLDEEMRSLYVERKAIYEDESNMLVSKRSNFDDDYYNDESDYDYNDSDSDRNGFDNQQLGTDNQSNSFPQSSSTSNLIRSRRSKSKKSEKLFDKIKDKDATIFDNGLKETKTSKRRSREKSDLKDGRSVKNKDSKVSKVNQRRSAPIKNNSEMKMDSDRDNSEIKMEPEKDNSEMKMDSDKDKSEMKRDLDRENSEIKMDPYQDNSEIKMDPDRDNSSLWNSDDSDITSSDFTSDSSSGSTSSIGKKQRKAKRRAKRDNFCFQCSDEFKKDDTLVECSGICGRKFHLKCNHDTNMIFIEDENQYICEECHTGKFRCFACRSPDNLDTKKCENRKCNKYYHLTCIEHYPIGVNETANTFLCPLHNCVNCFLLTMDDNEYRMNKRKLVRCIRCPLAYHANDVCIGAGAVRLSNNYVICSEHYDEFNRNRNNRHINVNYCFACIKVGNLICCEKCPAAFHEECLQYKFDHEKSFYCSSCLVHKQIHYGDIAWVKLGQFRWWPGRICHPNDVPTNVLNLNHNIGEFPVYFFGSHNYFWANKGRTFHFVAGDAYKILGSNSSKKNSSRLKDAFKLAIKEATDALKEWKERLSANNFSTIANKPPPYQHIHSNRYFNPKHNQNNIESNKYHICECNDKMENPCSDETCLNRVSFIECNPKTCPAGSKCLNQCFRKCKYVKCKTFRTRYAGWGLLTLENIKKGQFIIEYCGEIIDEKECEKRLEKISSTQANFYFLTIDKDNIIDAGPKGNLSRFMNHSCEPNCVTQKWIVNNGTRIGLFALEDIPAGAELTFNYNLDSRGNEKIVCKCHTSKCAGYIGGKIVENDHQNKRLSNGSKTKNGKTANGSRNNTNNNVNDNNNNNNSNTANMMHETVCFKCGEKKNLVECNQCTKSYHLACINLTTVPQNDWICPRHTCMKCSQSALIFCSVCPNSLCKEHATKSKNLQLPDNQFLCGDHRSSDDEGLIIEDLTNTTDL